MTTAKDLEDLKLDLDLADAFRSVKHAYDGTHEESNLTLQRALFQTRVRERRQKLTRWVVLPIAAVLVASTAFASVRGGLVPAVKSAIESLHAEHAEAPPPPAVVKTLPKAAAVIASAEPSAAPPIAAEAPMETPPIATPTPAATPVVRAPVKPAVVVSAPPAIHAPPEPAGPRAPPQDSKAPPMDLSSDPNAPLFAEAHRLHFVERDPARALVAWDRYLATGAAARFAPEARYNRALTLVRLGRRDEAKKELGAFADGTYGNYRRSEARALLEVL